MLRAGDFDNALGQKNNPDWKTVAWDERKGEIVVPNGSIGFRWGEDGKWNLEEKAGRANTALRLTQILEEHRDEVVGVDFPYFGGAATGPFVRCEHPDVLTRNVPVRRIRTTDGEVLVATVFDLFCANYGLDRGLGGDWVASDYGADVPYTPAWAEKITGVKANAIATVAREFALNAEKTRGKSMVILGAGLNHWYHMDMAYRGIINMLVMCGCVGQSGGGWSHYVGQEKLRPQTGWTALAFALDWARPPRHMNSTSAWYAHTDQWRYETVSPKEILSPTAPEGNWDGTLIDFNIRAERMGWLPSAPQLKTNPLEVGRAAKAAGKDVKDYVVEGLKSGELEMSCEDPDAPENWPRNLFVWRSNLLGSSGKGHEYFLKHLLGTLHGVLGKDLGTEGSAGSREAKWHETAPEGKLDLLVTLDFRMSTTAVYSDIVLPAASWYEKDDLNTSDMHPFIHPLQAAVDPAYEVALGLGDLQDHRPQVQRDRAGTARGRGRRGPVAASARQPRRGHAGRGAGLEAWRVRADPRADRAELHRGSAGLSEPLQTLHLARAADGEDRQRRQGHRLGHQGGSAPSRRSQRRGARGGRDQGAGQDRDGHRRGRSGADAGPGDQRSGGGEGLASARQDHRARSHPPGGGQAGREDPLPRHRRPAAQDHLVADLVRHRERGGVLQRRLYQRARADPLAHPQRAAAALSGPPVDAGVRRGAGRLPPAGGPQDHHQGGQSGCRARGRRTWC